MKLRVKNNLFGFTLVELLVSITMVGILAAMSLALLEEYRIRAHDSARTTDVRNIQSAVEAYAATNQLYPSSAGYGGGSSFANDCSNYGSGQWESFFTDHGLDELTGAIIRDPLYPDNPWPFCYMYLNAGYHQCSLSSSEYTLLFATVRALFGLELYKISGEGGSAHRYCIQQ